VIDVELSPDGRRVVTASGDGSARLWDAGTGDEVAHLGTCNVLGASFSPDGRRIAVECADAVRVFTAAGSLERELVVARSGASQAPVAYARWIGDGRRFATSTRGVLEIWDVATGHRVWASPEDRPQGRIAIAPGGTLVASMTVGTPEVTLWNAATGASLRVLRLEATRVESFYLEPTALAFDPSGARLFTVARRTEVVQIWDVASSQLAGTLEPRAGVISSLHVTKTGRAVIATGNAIQIWTLATATLERTLAIGANRVLDLALDPDDKLLGATMNDGAVAIWNLASGIPIAGLQGHDGAVQTLAFDPGGERVVTAGTDTTAIVWNLLSTTTTKVMAIESPANRLDVRGGRMLVATDHATVWNLSDGKLVAQRAIGPNADARFVDDHTIAIVDREGRLVRWDPATSAVREVARHRRPGDWVEVDGAGSFASWAGPEVIVAERGQRFRWEAPADIVALAFVPSGGLAIADAEGTIHVLDARGKLVRSWLAKKGAKERVSRLLALADGRVISSSSYVVRVWSTNGQQVHELEHPTASVWTMAIDRAGTRLATAGGDGTIRIWDLATYQLRTKLPHTWSVRQLAFTGDDQILTTLDDVGVVHVWSLATGDPLFRFLAHHGRGLIGVADSAIVTAGQESIAVFPTR
jgi:WD40 repeat protein